MNCYVPQPDIKAGVDALLVSKHILQVLLPEASEWIQGEVCGIYTLATEFDNVIQPLQIWDRAEAKRRGGAYDLPLPCSRDSVESALGFLEAAR